MAAAAAAAAVVLGIEMCLLLLIQLFARDLYLINQTNNGGCVKAPIFPLSLSTELAEFSVLWWSSVLYQLQHSPELFPSPQQPLIVSCLLSGDI